MKSDLLINERLQYEFAELSGDFNPLHVDQEFSRRSVYGAPVVHGVHLLLAALEQIGFDSTQRITFLEAEFRSAVLVGEPFSVEITSVNSMRKILLTSKKRVCAVFQIRTEQTTPIEPPPNNAYDSAKCAESIGLDDALLVQGVDTGVVSAMSIKRFFPNLSQHLIHSDIDLLLMMTRTIGMKCPGSRALFRSFNWTLIPKHNQDAKTYRVSKIDRRFDLVEIEFMANSVVAKALAKVRQAPVHQPSSEFIQSFVSTNEFIGVRSLVIGGSRGLGELAVRILSCGGADVLFTYFKGESDSKKLASSLRGNVNCRFFDARNPDEIAIKDFLSFRPTHLFYFATPTIQRQFAKEFNESLYQDFRIIFLDGFRTLCTRLSLSSALFPSTTFIDTREPGFDEYIQAKLDGEEFCETFRQGSNVAVYCDRLPPLVTDQTTELLGGDTISNVEVLVPLIRKTMISSTVNN